MLRIIAVVGRSRRGAVLDAETGATEDARRLVAERARDGCWALRMDANWHGACVLADAAVLVGDREAGAALHALLEPHAHLSRSSSARSAASGRPSSTSGALAGLLGRDDEAEARLRRLGPVVVAVAGLVALPGGVGSGTGWPARWAGSRARGPWRRGRTAM